MKLLVPEQSYPEKYWFYYDHGKGAEYLSFMDCKNITSSRVPVYRLKGCVSLKRVRVYDYLFSDGPSFVSERLVAAMVDLGLQSDLQFVQK